MRAPPYLHGKEAAMAIVLDIPNDVQEHLEREWPDTPRRALEAVVVAGYRDGIFSHGRVGEILGLESTETDELLVRNNAFLDYDDDGLAADVEASQALGTR
jgi:predicted HTH domain antitoxin